MNNSTNYVQFTKDGIEVIIDTNTGEAYYPGYRSLARVCSLGLEKAIHHTQVTRTVESLLEGGTDFALIEAEVLTPGGLQGGTLIPRKLGRKVIRKYNEDLYETMADAGELVFLHQLAGFKVQSKLPHMMERIAEWRSWLTEPIPDGYWIVAQYSQNFIQQAEKDFDWSVTKWKDLCDGSIGKHWANHLKQVKPEAITNRKKVGFSKDGYTFKLSAYQSEYLGMFHDWLESTYRSLHYPVYLADKAVRDGKILKAL